MTHEHAAGAPAAPRGEARFRARAAALALLIAAGAAAAPARAAFPPTVTQTLLTTSASPAVLRARLDSLAGALAAKDPPAAGEARYYQGMSFARAGLLDSAITAYQAALALRNGREELLGLADARLLREAPGDAVAVLAGLGKALVESGGETVYSQIPIQRRLAWAHVLAGHPDSAAAIFTATEDMPGLRLEWRYRMGVAALDAGDAQKAFGLLFPVALAGRKQDPEVMRQLERAAAKLDAAAKPATRLDAELRRGDAREQRLFESWGGRRLVFRGDDGFPLTGFLVPPRAPARSTRGAIVLMASTDSLANYDSLAIALSRHGVATLLMPSRGTNWAVGPACPIPDAWEGREEQLQHQTARDVRRALTQLAAATPLDTTRYAVVGVGSTVVSAAEAGRLDPRVRALLLVSPFVSPVDRGPTFADLQAAGLPAFFQISPEDFDVSYDITELLYLAGHRAASRVVEGNQAGRGVAQFRIDPSLLPRLVSWLDDAFKTPPAKATRPAPRRKG